MGLILGFNNGFNIGFNIWFNIGVQYWFQYLVQYWVLVLGFNIASNIAFNFGFKIGFNIGFNILFNIGLDIRFWFYVQTSGVVSTLNVVLCLSLFTLILGFSQNINLSQLVTSSVALPAPLVIDTFNAKATSRIATLIIKTMSRLL